MHLTNKSPQISNFEDLGVLSQDPQHGSHLSTNFFKRFTRWDSPGPEPNAGAADPIRTSRERGWPLVFKRWTEDRRLIQHTHLGGCWDALHRSPAGAILGLLRLLQSAGLGRRETPQPPRLRASSGSLSSGGRGGCVQVRTLE